MTGVEGPSARLRTRARLGASIVVVGGVGVNGDDDGDEDAGAVLGEGKV
jgi:hypothetical protein